MSVPMSHLPNALHLIGRLLNYPEPGMLQLAQRLCGELQDDLLAAAPGGQEFLAFTLQNDDIAIEEAFTSTFDINPDCALEVGWHLFGEEYIRGLFLVRMREELRKYGLPETVELPDHIAHVLGVVAAMPPQEATRFVCACVLPAVIKMHQALADKDTPYRHLLCCLESVLTIQWGDEFTASGAATPAVGTPRTGTGDLLRAFPIADAPGACEACSRISSDAVPHNFIPREMEFPQSRGGGGHRDLNPMLPGNDEQCQATGPSLRVTDRDDASTPNPARKR